MKTSKFHLLAIAFLIGLSFTACKKSDSTDNSLKDQSTVAATQDAESQDAQADNVDQSVDDITGALEANNFSAVKSAQAGGPSWVVTSSGGLTPSDTSKAAFPKTITLTYATDTLINGEKFKQTGQIIITVSLTQNAYPWKNYLKWSLAFSNFKTENDSASFMINGTRTVTRKEIKLTPPITPNNILTVTKLRLSVLDSIKSNFTFTTTIISASGNYTKNFTRVVNKTRQGIAHFEKITDTRIWHQVLLQDTMIFNGSVTGVNLMDSAYSRVITEPIVITRCALLVPVISSGTITITRNTPKGTKEGTITYSKDACRTIVTLKVGDKTKEIERKLNRSYKQWW